MGLGRLLRKCAGYVGAAVAAIAAVHTFRQDESLGKRALKTGALGVTAYLLFRWARDDFQEDDSEPAMNRGVARPQLQPPPLPGAESPQCRFPDSRSDVIV